MMNKIVIDLFCGAGGESCGIHNAFKKRNENIKLFAVNHWATACETHSANFPADECICQDIQTVIPTDLVKAGESVELLWASPECTHFSTARGGKPMDDQSRCTPFDILRWVTMVDVQRVIIENVPEFLTWGPLDSKTQRPIEEEKGKFFRAFVHNLKDLGYAVDWRICCAADYGAPTTRRRLFVQATKGRKRIVWPTPTHQKIEKGELQFFAPWVPASEIIDWSIPCPPTDERKRPLAPATMRRILNGIQTYWGEFAEPFLVRYNGGDNRHHSIHEPVPTLDTSNRYGLVQPLIAEMYGTGGCKPVERTLGTVTCSGAHHALVQPLIMEYYGNGRCRPVTEPLGTVTCKERFALVRPEDCRIGFRMLQPHELAKAQSFPDWYKFTGSKTDVVKQIGNAVCPKVAEALAI